MQVPPKNAADARRLLYAAARIAVWAHRTLATSDPTIVLDPRNVEHWTMTQNPDRTVVWREKTRWTLRTLGQAVNPEAWPAPTQKVGKRKVARPYTPGEEEAFRFAAGLPRWANRTKRLWIVVAALGTGLNNTETAAARTGDLEHVGDGRLAVRVRGRNPRLVPIRTDYTTLARTAAEGSPTDRFIPTDGRNSVHSVAGRLDPGDGHGLSLRRARSTWLAAHLMAGTPLAMLRIVAGPLSANTLDSLLRHTTYTLNETTAAMRALGA